VPLAAVGARPDVARGLADAIEAWSPALAAYRSAEPWRAHVVRWLRQA
jgi:hypothetical protein